MLVLNRDDFEREISTFPHVFLELTDTEVNDCYKPSDLTIGKTINIYGRNFLINDCDLFTKTFYTKNVGVSNFETINTEEPRNEFSKMDSPRGDDKLRKFITSYRLSYDTISIHELPQRHTGIIRGRFLQQTCVSKSNSSFEHPQFYSPGDFYIGATIEVFHQRFIIRLADLFVLKYAEQFSPTVIESLR
ncbi:unnamed protein product [Rotaria sordida]|uniref:DM10 domain-containing protein n=1 Tax=Rotaria sordida TaxID=392033 RepID=A0A814HH15_9BILA|nr:unnamed protein product [Rotaria sordida]CAF1167441.1 unnamed protein product [Rotaria sordida]